MTKRTEKSENKSSEEDRGGTGTEYSSNISNVITALSIDSGQKKI